MFPENLLDGGKGGSAPFTILSFNDLQVTECMSKYGWKIELKFGFDILVGAVPAPPPAGGTAHPAPGTATPPAADPAGGTAPVGLIPN